MEQSKNMQMKKVYAGVVLAALFVAADQWSKFAMRNFMTARDELPLDIIPGFFRLLHSYNTGVAFGMFKNAPVVVLYLPALLIAGLMLYMLRSGKPSFFKFAGLTLILGGAAGNFIDRVRFGKVYDFLDVYIGQYHWPAFNAADSFIVIGIAMLGIALLRGELDE